MAKKPFVVIDAEILSSSVWQEALHVKVVWLTLLILCDTEGYVGAALPGIATAAGVTLAQAEEAMKRLQEPDPYSRTQANEGRRIETAERGWRVLNFVEVLDRLSRERKRDRDRVRKFRQRKREKEKESVTTCDMSRSVTPENIPTPSSLQSVAVEQRNQVPTTERPGPKRNPLVEGRRPELEKECGALIREVSKLSGKDPVEVLALCASYPGAQRQKVNYTTLTDDRLANTVLDLRKTRESLKRKAAEEKARQERPAW